MKKTVLALTVAVSVLLATGCNKEGVSYSGDKAQLTLSLTATGSFVEVSPVSKSEETADVNEFAINIVDVASGRTVYSWDRYADMPGTVSLDPAVYRVEAGSGEKQPVAWNQPVFFGSQEVTVEAGSTAQVSVVCTIANMKVTVRCTDSFLAEVETDFTVTVTTEDGPLIFTKDRIDAGDAGYFDVAPLTMDLYAVRKNGGTVTHQEHIIIDGTDEPDTPGADAVTITATAGIDAPVTYNKSELPSEFNLTVSAPAGIEKYEVNILSAGLRALLDMMQMDYSVDLANMSATEEDFWGSLFGITSDDVKGQTDVVFQIGAFLAAMPAETNELQVVITDKNGETATAALTIIMTE